MKANSKDAVQVERSLQPEGGAHEKQDGLADRLLAIGKQAAPHWKEPFRSVAHGNLLYGADGLPKDCS